MGQRDKLKLGNKLKDALREGIGTVSTEAMFLIRFPDITEHKFHDQIQVNCFFLWRGFIEICLKYLHLTACL